MQAVVAVLLVTQQLLLVDLVVEALLVLMPQTVLQELLILAAAVEVPLEQPLMEPL